jgi:hypothetical protein
MVLLALVRMLLAEASFVIFLLVAETCHGNGKSL